MTTYRQQRRELVGVVCGVMRRCMTIGTVPNRVVIVTMTMGQIELNIRRISVSGFDNDRQKFRMHRPDRQRSKSKAKHNGSDS